MFHPHSALYSLRRSRYARRSFFIEVIEDKSSTNKLLIWKSHKHEMLRVFQQKPDVANIKSKSHSVDVIKLDGCFEYIKW